MGKQEQLLQYYKTNPPDLKKREYYQSLGLRTSDAEVGDVAMGKMCSTPAPMRSSIFTYDRRSQRRPSINDPGQTGQAASQSTMSLVAPLLWVPGVLRSSGPWATVMKETQDGPTYAMPGVDLIKEDPELPTGSSKKENLREQLQQKNQLISELERSISRQSMMNEKTLKETRKQTKSVLGQLAELRRSERERSDKEIQARVRPLQEEVASLREDLTTTNKAMKVRVKRAYAQDNFLSSYSKGMSHIGDMARELADKEGKKLRQEVALMQRRFERDSVYKKALRMRTETAEIASEKRYTEAEARIPVLQKEVLMATLKLGTTERLFQDKLNRSLHELDQVSGVAKADAQEKARLAAENAKLKAQVSELDYKFRTAQKALEGLRLKTRSPGSQPRSPGSQPGSPELRVMSPAKSPGIQQWGVPGSPDTQH